MDRHRIFDEEPTGFPVKIDIEIGGRQVLTTASAIVEGFWVCGDFRLYVCGSDVWWVEDLPRGSG
jgi:hypothetical protein